MLLLLAAPVQAAAAGTAVQESRFLLTASAAGSGG